MPRKQKKKPPAKQPSMMRWEFDADIPTHDFFESGSLDEMWNLQEAVDGFVHWLEDDRFLTWEAVADAGQARPVHQPGPDRSPSVASREQGK